MIEKHLQVQTADGIMETFLAHPDSEAAMPAVVLYMDAPGIREELYGFARRIAAQGYCCLLPDLYYRLSAVRLVIPPLRERPADIRALADLYVAEWQGRFGPACLEITPEAMRSLLSYDWPGNIRELRNVLESAAFQARLTGRIDRIHLPREVAHPDSEEFDGTLPGRLRLLEHQEIRRAILATDGNKTAAAVKLGITRKGLNDKLRRLGMEEYILPPSGGESGEG